MECTAVAADIQVSPHMINLIFLFKKQLLLYNKIKIFHFCVHTYLDAYLHNYIQKVLVYMAYMLLLGKMCGVLMCLRFYLLLWVEKKQNNVAPHGTHIYLNILIAFVAIY
jgi:hypothetical protein